MSRWIAASIVVLIGCGGKSGSKIADDHRAKAEPILAQLAAIAPVVKAAPPVTTDGFTLPAGVKVDFDLTMPNEANSNAGVVYAGALTDPCNDDGILKWEDGKELGVGPLDKTDTWLRQPACFLKTGKGYRGVEDYPLDQLERQFTLLEKMKYVLVVRPSKLTRPVITTDKTYTPGVIAGDAKLYELATGKDLGGIRFSYASAEEIKVVGSDQSNQVEEDLEKDTRFGIAKQLMATKTIMAWP